MEFKRVEVKRDLDGVTFANMGKFVKIEKPENPKPQNPKEEKPKAKEQGKE